MSRRNRATRRIAAISVATAVAMGSFGAATGSAQTTYPVPVVPVVPETGNDAALKQCVKKAAKKKQAKKRQKAINKCFAKFR